MKVRDERLKRQIVKTRLLAPHAPNCYAIKNCREGTWPTPWWIPDGALVYRDAIGRNTKSAGRRWLQLKCNCTDCPAQMLVLELDLLAVVPNY